MENQATSIVALIGRPNVGKSTLFNRITRSRKAIVDPTPGVTRDRQYERVNWKGQFFILVDTGGIDEDSDDIMVDTIREQAMAALDEADVILFIMDGKSGLMPVDYEVVELLRRSQKKVVFVVNKVDGPEIEHERLAPFYELGAEELWPLSAEHSYGFNNLMDHLCENLPEDPTPADLPENTVRMAFLGRPNVGKSSMINRILGKERMVVSEISGTTRDSVDTLLTHKERNYLLIDTAGIRRKGKTQEKLEKFSIIKALAALNRCEIAIVLIDASEGITEQDAKVIGYTQESGRGLVLLVNKWDLVEGDKKRQEQLREEIARAVPFVGFAPADYGFCKNRIRYQENFPRCRLGSQAIYCDLSHFRPEQAARGRGGKSYPTHIQEQAPEILLHLTVEHKTADLCGDDQQLQRGAFFL